MKITIDKCEQCGRLFEDEIKYKDHLQVHHNLLAIEKVFPSVKDNLCKFANGGWSVQRSKEWLDKYKAEIIKLIPTCDDTLFSYSWWRYLSDSHNPYYTIAWRILKVCPKCYREWGQPFYAINCTHTDKVKEDEDESEII